MQDGALVALPATSTGHYLGVDPPSRWWPVFFCGVISLDAVGDLKAGISSLASHSPIATIGKGLEKVGEMAQDAYSAAKEKLTPVTTAAKKNIVPLPRVKAKGRAYGKGRGLSKGR